MTPVPSPVDADEAQLPALWLAAARRPDIADALEAVYQIIADQVAARRPVCVSSGRCCHFEAHGHRLYTTGLEAAYTVARLDAAPQAADVHAALDRGDCPFLRDERCTIHDIKPSGCRIYFCDPAARGWQPILSERTLAMIRELHDRHQLPYRYGEWRSMLLRFVQPA